MQAFTTTWPLLIIALLYLVVAGHYWMHRPKPGQPAPTMPTWYPIALAAGLILHGTMLYQSLFSTGLNLGFSNALSIVAWLTVLIYWIANLQQPLQGLQSFVLPPAAFFVLLQIALPETHLVPYAGNPLFMAHMMIALLAYSLFTFAALHALLMALAERSLHDKTSFIRQMDFPPIITMERLLFQVIGFGFLLLTFTLISGMLFSEEIFHQALKFNHKNIFTIVSWLVFGSLLLGRRIQGWRGRVAIRWTLTGFVMLVLAYAGSKFVLEVILHRT